MSPQSSNGFTLVEFMLAITIVTVILTVLLMGQSTYNDKLALRNLVDDASLRIFQAQAYGSGVKEFSAGLGEFSASYGLTFSLIDSGSPTAFLYFADRDGDDTYDGDWDCDIGGTNECLEKINITRGNVIEFICFYSSPSFEACSASMRVDISFNRPNTEAEILFFDSAGLQIVPPPGTTGARIYFESPAGNSASVIILQTGQVSVQ